MKYSLFTVLSYLILPTVALAGSSEGFVPLVGIPGLSNEQAPTFDSYIDALYALAISVAALIAVIQIVIGGAQYMMDDLITSKSAAKERIKNALIGLLIIIAAALILTTINSNLTNLEINAPVIEIDNSSPTSTPGTVGGAIADCQGDADCVVTNCSSLNSKASLLGVAYTPLPEIQCQRICTEIGGTFVDTLNNNQQRCVYSQENYNAALDETRTRLEETLCPGSDTDFTCTIQPCLNESVLSSCSTWCNQNGNLEFDEGSRVCYAEIGREGVFERGITDRVCPPGDVCTVQYCLDNDPSSYCNRGDDIYTFTNRGACENLEGIYDSQTDTCVFLQSNRR